MDLAVTRLRSFNRRAICIGLCALRITASYACDVRQWDGLIQEAAERFHVNRELIGAVIQVESNACERSDGKLATSAAGAMGLMQLMPSTWNKYRERLHLGTNSYDPLDNILAGSASLHDLIQRFGVLDGLAAYFAGPSGVTNANNSEMLASPATLRYVRDVLAILSGDTTPAVAHQRGIAEPTVRLFAIERAQSRRGNDVPMSGSSTLFAIPRAHMHDKTFSGESAGLVQ
jgi:soluble lytic murein transglycosylase-like protein